ncbi:alpha-1,6-mannosyl-glycoprotein 2-beta-N-acetylglucosaminyltransferase [Callorhinchus milii]|uniref:Alpha-1,6-mannosyl-glycoprotein 2-beta-N-acetylglucosaminyltransferase n=1 Tax=Callorhinchus milii TaxID=7868 RepID=V9KLC2_CALMI|nr:alpha-1,6-mannosyl-glycoprotein 2-beta-N-acetylglucosaminyltransferase [Callorhinchus milii]
MRCRVYKRKVLLLALVVLVTGFAFWTGTGGGGGGGGKPRKSPETYPREDEPSRHTRVSHADALRKAANESTTPSTGRIRPPAEVDNLTLVYRGVVYQLNFDQTVRNREKPRSPGDLVLVVQVHNRPDHLQLLIHSLRRAKGIERVLLIFSHDFWSPRINQIVAGVDFCQVLQIFFPFSLQLYPNEFPGHDPKDCPRDLNRRDALKLRCNNAEYPDSFGHYRESKFCQTKHHWWWKLHYVWERVNVLKDHNGPMLFIEEDHYLSPDFYLVFKSMWSLKTEHCPDCDLLSLGTYTRVLDFTDKGNKVEVKTWRSTEHNMGMVMSRDTYQKMLECTNTFCEYDDYNWDWTLQQLTVSCLPRHWKVMVCEAPRIFHAGDCGLHHKKACMPSVENAKIDKIISTNMQHLFPEAMVISRTYPLIAISPRVKNGGWGDIRDHELCKSYRRLQ